MYDQDDMHGEFRQRNPMATASIALGIAALLSCPTFYTAIPCGALAILCAILSRGRFKLSGKGKAGIICGIIGMLLSAAITAFQVHTVMTNPLARQQVEQALQLYFGDPTLDLDTIMDGLFPALNVPEDDGSSLVPGETEEETQKRVRLRVADDADAPENITETPAEDPAPSDIVPEKDDEYDPAEEQEAPSPVTIPDGGGSFI